MTLELIKNLRARAEICKHTSNIKYLEEDSPDRIADLLEEAANTIESLQSANDGLYAACLSMEQDINTIENN